MTTIVIEIYIYKEKEKGGVDPTGEKYSCSRNHATFICNRRWFLGIR